MFFAHIYNKEPRKGLFIVDIFICCHTDFMMRNASSLTLGDQEMAVMECLWALGIGDVKAVHEVVGDNHNTVQSAMERLHRKGLLSRKKQGHAFIYTPLVSKKELAARLLEETLQRVRGTEPLPLLAAFVDLAVEHDQSVLDELERLVASYRAKEIKSAATSM